MRRIDPLIIGGGPAGSAAAIMLARDGARPLIIERQRVIGDALCGGFMSWRTLQQLDSLGVTREVLGGHPIDQVRIFAGNAMASARLPATAIGLSRQRLDTIMLDHAVTAGAQLEIATARSIEEGTVLTDGGTIESDSVFLATGKHDLRGQPRPRFGGDDPTLGLRFRLAAHPRLSGLIGSSIELHMFDRGYAGLLLQEDGSANLCMAFRKSRLAEAGGKPANLVVALAAENPLFDERLAWLDDLPESDAIASVPYGWRAMTTSAGMFRLGDQAAVIPSLAGEGMGIAIASGIAAARSWSNGGAAAAPDYQRQFAVRTRRPVGIAHLLWGRAERPWSAALGTHIVKLMPSLANILARTTRIRD